MVFPQKQTEGLEAEDRVLVDWLSKGKHLYRGADGEEVNVSGRLVWLLSKVSDTALRVKVEEVLKKTVSEKNKR